MTAVVTALTAVGMIVGMVAVWIGTVLESTVQESLYSVVGVTGDAAIELDVGPGQCVLGAGADPAAEDGIYLPALEQSCEGAVAGSLGGTDFGGLDGAVLHMIEFEGCRMAEVLEDLSIFIRDRNVHREDSFRLLH